MWHVRKLKLDQCFQLRLFEQDAEKVSNQSPEGPETTITITTVKLS
jgi:hypothetical protein